MRESVPVPALIEIRHIAAKEFRGFFATPAAYLFLGAFLGVTLFVFFWVESFFSRNIADLRPLFQWLPLLLIFLVAALTMRAWSEERRAGTLETLLTAPVRPLSLVLGKFAAALGLVAVALALTAPLPITVALLGPLDWGPVAGGYLATLFLAAAYVAIGLFTSGRTDNPIVALILTTVVCGLFYLIGADLLIQLFGHQAGAVLALLGAGSRFESITRGVVDLRDLYYYASIVGVFLTLNLYGLERLRRAGNPATQGHRTAAALAALTVANFVAANLWLAPVPVLRADLTQGGQYSLSAATREQLTELREPLLIRGYFSSKTHPLLAPLVPKIKDLLEEYAVAAGGRARIEFVDPTRDRAAEAEAASRYDIRPVPFQTATRYQSAVVSSYFDLVISYGDQYEKLGFRDLVDVKVRGERDLDVALKNPEYAITRSIRKVLNSYQSGGNPFEALAKPVAFAGYVSADDRLPADLKKLRGDLQTVLDELKAQAGDKLSIRFEDPDADGGTLAKQLAQRYGFGPQIASLNDPKPFWFYLLLQSDADTIQIPLPDTLDKDALKRSITAALQRFTPGFLRTVAVVKPSPAAPANPYAPRSAGPQYAQLEAALGQNLKLRDADLKDGRVPEDADLLLVLSPKDLDDRQRFAIDQFLMRGGSVVLATSPFDIQVGQTLTASKQSSGLQDWLAHYGVSIGETMVLDAQNAALPVPVERSIGGLPVREIRMLPYPHFPDLRGDGLNAGHPVTGSLGQLTVNWASPITVDPAKNTMRKTTELLRSSSGSWSSDSLDLIPDYRLNPDSGFPATGERKPQVLAVALEGRFDSFYAGKPSPLATSAPPAAVPAPGNDGTPPASRNTVTSVIERSPDSARLLVIASSSFGSDAAIDFESQGLGTAYTKPLEFLQNAVDWSLEDPALLSLRGRSQFARTLLPMPEARAQLWEYANYGLAVFGLGLVWLWRRRVAQQDQRRYQRILAEV
ncbi:Gldg family protein [Nevskia sp.]|uniref:Gldg family protein n=1 Tax=Nevskia sp. TaxID=1929292 RepID=UPI0025E6348E|nr:Gldg family protein [Nevskia sp.]